VGCIGLLVTVILFVVFIYYSVAPGRGSYSYFDDDFFHAGHIILGFGCIMSSIAIFQGKNYFTPELQARGLAQVAAGMVLLAGILFMVILGAYFGGWPVLGSSLILMSIVFYNAPLPVPEKGEDSTV
jgi:hypothetical protein